MSRRSAPRPRLKLPKLSYHKHSQLYYVRIENHPYYLGRDESLAAQERLRLLGEWQATGRAPAGMRPDRAGGPTVLVAAARYLGEFVQKRYRKHDRPTSEQASIGEALRPLLRLYGHRPLAEIGLPALESVRREMQAHGCGKAPAESGVGDKVANQHMGRVERFLRWCAAREICPPAVWHAAQVLEPLHVPRQAWDDLQVDPPPPGAVAAALPHMSPTLAAMVRLEALTGARPHEVCQLRPCDLDRTGARLRELAGAAVELAGCWAWLPREHKTEHHGHGRIIPVAPAAQDVLAPLLVGRDSGAEVFSPAEAWAWRREQLRRARVSRVQPSQVRRGERSPGRQCRASFTPRGYYHAVGQACDRAERTARLDLASRGVSPPVDRICPRWSPNQLRHEAATELARLFGWEIARKVLGHTSVNTTRIYVKDSMGEAFAALGGRQTGAAAPRGPLPNDLGDKRP